MASFNLTAQINIVGPNNLKPIISNIRKQIQTINPNIKLNIDVGNVSKINSLFKNISSNANNLNANIKNLSTSVNSLQRDIALLNNASSSSRISSLAASAQKVSTSAAKASKNIKDASYSIEEFGKQSALAIRRFAAFSIVTGLIYKVSSSLADATTQFITFNRELVRLAQITDSDVSALGDINNAITTLSTNLGVSSSKLISITSTLAQAGFSIQETEAALEALAKSALAPSFDDLNHTVEGSIALLRQFSIETHQLEGALGSINAVAASFAVEAGDIIAAIQRTGGVFANASKGVAEGTEALNQFIALFTSVRATSRESAETIATGLRTIFTRIQRKDTIDLLTDFGIKLTDLEGKFVGPYEAVRRLSQGLSQLDPRDIRFSQIIEELGGFRQVGKVIPLIKEFSTAQRALSVAQKGSNSLTEDASIAQQALVVQMTKVQEQFISMVRDIGNSDQFQTIAKAALDLASALIEISRSAKYALPAITGMLAIRGVVGGARFLSGFRSGLRGSNTGAARTTIRGTPYATGGQVQKFARGGIVPGVGNTDSFKASLRQGDFVIKKSSVNSIGPENLQKMSTYASGGFADKTVPALLTPGEWVFPKEKAKKIGYGKLNFMNKHGKINSDIPIENRYSSGTSSNGVKPIRKAKKQTNLPIDGRTEFTHIKTSSTTIPTKLKKYAEQNNLGNINRLYSNMGLDLPMTWNRNWDNHNPDFYGAFNTKFSSYVENNDVFKTLRLGNNQLYRFTGRSKSKAQNILSDNYENIQTQLAAQLQNTPLFFDTDPDVEKVVPKLLKKSVNIELGKDSRKAAQLISGFEETSAIKFRGINQRKPITKGMRQTLNNGGVVKRRIGYIDYDVIANPVNEAIVAKGMEQTGANGIRLYADHLTELATRARKDSSIDKLRAIYGVAGSGKTTLARGQGTDKGSLRETERFPILKPADIQKANEVIVLSSSVSNKKLDEVFSQADRTYTLSSTTASDKSRILSQRVSRDQTGVGLEGRKPGTTTKVEADTAIGEALLSDRLGDRSVVLGRTESGNLRRKSKDELVQIIKKKIGFTWGGFSPMTAGHESIMDAAAAVGIPAKDFIYLVGSNEAIKNSDPSSYRTAIFDQDARVLLAKAGAGSRGATVLPKDKGFEVPQAFDIGAQGGRRQVIVPAKGSTVFAADKDEKSLSKYKEAGYDVRNLERTGGISGTQVRDLIMSGNMGQLQKVLTPNVYELISNNIRQIRNRANVLPEIITEVKKRETVSLSEIESQIKSLGISRIDNKKVESDPEYAAQVDVLKELRKKRDKIKSFASFEPYSILSKMAAAEPEQYGLDLTMPISSIKPIRQMAPKIQKANLGGSIQRFMSGGIVQKFLDGGWVGRMKKQSPEDAESTLKTLNASLEMFAIGQRKVPNQTFNPAQPWEDIGAREVKQRIVAIKDYLQEKKLEARKKFASRKGAGLKPTDKYNEQEMLDAITLYQAGSGPFTTSLASGKKTFKDREEKYQTSDIRDRLLAASQFDIPKNTYSGLGRSQLKKILNDTGITAQKLSSKTSESLKALVGKRINFPTFLSTSVSKSVAESFVQNPGALLNIDGSSASQKTIDVIKAKNKTKVSAKAAKSSRRLSGLDKINDKKIADYDDEKEFIIPPNTTFQIIKATGNVDEFFPKALKKKPTEEDKFIEFISDEYDEDPTRLDLKAKMLSGGGEVQKFKKGGEVFGTGETKFPRRISNAYAKKLEKDLNAAQFMKNVTAIPTDERIFIDEPSVASTMDQPFDRSKFLQSFKSKIQRDSLFKSIGDFARFIGLPQEDLRLALPTQIDFGNSSIRGRKVIGGGLFSVDPLGSRGEEGWDLSEFGYTEKDKQDLFGYEKLVEEKKKLLKKILKTPIKTFDDGSFTYDSETFNANFDEMKMLEVKISDIKSKKNKDIEAARAVKKQQMSETGRGNISLGTNWEKPGQDVLYHELTHQLINGLRSRSAESFEKYKQRVETLFNADNNGLADAFDTLSEGSSAGYTSADVVYGRKYKQSLLESAQIENIRMRDNSDKYNPELVQQLSSNIQASNDARKARQYRPINPSVNKALLAAGFGQDHIAKTEDNGKEEFLTTLVQKAPTLDSSLQNVLNSTLTELLGDAGIQRQKFARGGIVPGVGNGDSVKASLREGDFVIKRSSVESIGAHNLQRMARYATGGNVEKVVPALLTPGEWVFPKEKAKKIGYSKLNKMNRYGKFAFGGSVQKLAIGGEAKVGMVVSDVLSQNSGSVPITTDNVFQSTPQVPPLASGSIASRYLLSTPEKDKKINSGFPNKLLLPDLRNVVSNIIFGGSNNKTYQTRVAGLGKSQRDSFDSSIKKYTQEGIANAAKAWGASAFVNVNDISFADDFNIPPGSIGSMFESMITGLRGAPIQSQATENKRPFDFTSGLGRLVKTSASSPGFFNLDPEINYVDAKKSLSGAQPAEFKKKIASQLAIEDFYAIESAIRNKYKELSLQTPTKKPIQGYQDTLSVVNIPDSLKQAGESYGTRLLVSQLGVKQKDLFRLGYIQGTDNKWRYNLPNTQMQRKALGGVIDYLNTSKPDDRLIVAQDGEYVLDRQTARSIGKDNLDIITGNKESRNLSNNKLPKYHKGGAVGSVQKLATGGGPLQSNDQAFQQAYNADAFITSIDYLASDLKGVSGFIKKLGIGIAKVTRSFSPLTNVSDQVMASLAGVNVQALAASRSGTVRSTENKTFFGNYEDAPQRIRRYEGSLDSLKGQTREMTSGMSTVQKATVIQASRTAGQMTSAYYQDTPDAGISATKGAMIAISQGQSPSKINEAATSKVYEEYDKDYNPAKITVKKPSAAMAPAVTKSKTESEASTKPEASAKPSAAMAPAVTKSKTESEASTKPEASAKPSAPKTPDIPPPVPSARPEISDAEAAAMLLEDEKSPTAKPKPKPKPIKPTDFAPLPEGTVTSKTFKRDFRSGTADTGKEIAQLSKQEKELQAELTTTKSDKRILKEKFASDDTIQNEQKNIAASTAEIRKDEARMKEIGGMDRNERKGLSKEIQDTETRLAVNRGKVQSSKETIAKRKQDIETETLSPLIEEREQKRTKLQEVQTRKSQLIEEQKARKEKSRESFKTGEKSREAFEAKNELVAKNRKILGGDLSSSGMNKKDQAIVSNAMKNNAAAFDRLATELPDDLPTDQVEGAMKKLSRKLSSGADDIDKEIDEIVNAGRQGGRKGTGGSDRKSKKGEARETTLAGSETRTREEVVKNLRDRQRQKRESSPISGVKHKNRGDLQANIDRAVDSERGLFETSYGGKTLFGKQKSSAASEAGLETFRREYEKTGDIEKSRKAGLLASRDFSRTGEAPAVNPTNPIFADSSKKQQTPSGVYKARGAEYLHTGSQLAATAQSMRQPKAPASKYLGAGSDSVTGQMGRKALAPLVSAAGKVSTVMGKLHNSGARFGDALVKMRSSGDGYISSIRRSRSMIDVLSNATKPLKTGLSSLVNAAKNAARNLNTVKSGGGLFGGGSGGKRGKGGILGRLMGGGGKGGGGGMGGGMGGMLGSMIISMAGDQVVSGISSGLGGEETASGRSATSIGGGALTGASTGAMIGSVVPGLGTVIGGAIGAGVGGAISYYGGGDAATHAKAIKLEKSKVSMEEGVQQVDTSLAALSNPDATGQQKAKASKEMMEGFYKAESARKTQEEADLEHTRTWAEYSVGADGGPKVKAEERVKKAQPAADAASKILAKKMQDSGKNLEELSSSMPENEFRQLTDAIVATDTTYQQQRDMIYADGKVTEQETKSLEIARKAALKRASKDLELAGEAVKLKSAMRKLGASFDQTAQNMISAVGAGSSILDNAQIEMESISDPTKAVMGASQISKSADILNNPNAYSSAEIKSAAGQYSGFFGQDAEAMTNAAALPQTFKEDLGSTVTDLKDQGKDLDSDEAKKAVKDSLMNTIRGAFPQEIAEGMKGQVESFVQNFEGDIETLTFDKLAAEIPELANTVAASEKALQSFQAVAKFTSDSLKMMAQTAQNVAASEQQMRNNDASTFQAIEQSNIDFDSILGEKPSWTQGASIRTEAKAIRMGTTAEVASDPTKILARIRDTRSRLGEAQQRQQETAKTLASSTDASQDQANIQANQNAALEVARLGQSAAQAQEELKSLPGEIQQNISGILTELQQVMQERAAKINAGASLMEKVLTSTPKGLRKMGDTMNNLNRAMSGNAVSFQESKAANVAYQQVRRQGGTHQQAQRAAQDAYAQETGDTLSMAKELAPLLGAVDPAAQSKMMAGVYESMFAARGMDPSQMQVGDTNMAEILKKMKEGPAEDPKVQALKAALEAQQQALADANDAINANIKDQALAQIQATGEAITKAIEEVRVRFDEAQLKNAGLNIVRPGEGTAANKMTPEQKKEVQSAAQTRLEEDSAKLEQMKKDGASKEEIASQEKEVALSQETELAARQGVIPQRQGESDEEYKFRKEGIEQRLSNIAVDQGVPVENANLEAMQPEKRPSRPTRSTEKPQNTTEPFKAQNDAIAQANAKRNARMQELEDKEKNGALTVGEKSELTGMRNDNKRAESLAQQVNATEPKVKTDTDNTSKANMAQSTSTSEAVYGSVQVSAETTGSTKKNIRRPSEIRNSINAFAKDQKKQEKQAQEVEKTTKPIQLNPYQTTVMERKVDSAGARASRKYKEENNYSEESQKLKDLKDKYSSQDGGPTQEQQSEIDAQQKKVDDIKRGASSAKSTARDSANQQFLQEQGFSSEQITAARRERDVAFRSRSPVPTTQPSSAPTDDGLDVRQKLQRREDSRGVGAAGDALSTYLKHRSEMSMATSTARQSANNTAVSTQVPQTLPQGIQSRPLSEQYAATKPGGTQSQNPQAGVLDTKAFDNFASKLDNLLGKLADISIPSEIKLTGNSNVNVVINEPESMKNLSGQLKADIMKQVSLEIDKKLGNYDRETSGEGAADKSKIMGKN